MYTHMYSDLNLESSSTMAVHSACHIIFISISRTDLQMAAVRYDAEETRWWGADNHQENEEEKIIHYNHSMQ